MCVFFFIFHCSYQQHVVHSGLLSAHILAEHIQKDDKKQFLKWYRGELLEMAKDLGYRLLPAFNTTTGIPHARINLKYGMKSDELKHSRESNFDFYYFH